MITDEIIDAIDLLIEMCSGKEQKNGMESVKEILMDFDNDKWLNMTESERREWLKEFS